MGLFQVRTNINGVETVSEPMSETAARATAINQSDTIANELEDDGYTIRYLQMVLDGPDGHEAIIDVEPA